MTPLSSSSLPPSLPHSTGTGTPGAPGTDALPGTGIGAPNVTGDVPGTGTTDGTGGIRGTRYNRRYWCAPDGTDGFPGTDTTVGTTGALDGTGDAGAGARGDLPPHAYTLDTVGDG